MADNNPANQAPVVPPPSLSPATVVDDPVHPADRGGVEALALRRQLAEQLRRRAERAQRCGNDVPCPCVSVCRVNGDNGFCEGCFRTLSEISSWGRSGPVWQKQLWRTILQRLDR